MLNFQIRFGENRGPAYLANEIGDMSDRCNREKHIWPRWVHVDVGDLFVPGLVRDQSQGRAMTT